MQRFSVPIEVTEEYLRTAVPNSHTVQELEAYTVNGVTYPVDGHNVVLDYSPHEREIAELLARVLGGEVFMVPRINEPPNISTPDYLFRGKKFDLKSPCGNGKNTLYDAIAKKAAQADNFIFDLTYCPLSEAEVRRQIALIYRSTHTRFVNVLIVVKNGIIRHIFKRNEQQS